MPPPKASIPLLSLKSLYNPFDHDSKCSRITTKNTHAPTPQISQMFTFCHLFRTISLWKETECERQHLPLPHPPAPRRTSSWKWGLSSRGPRAFPTHVRVHKHCISRPWAPLRLHERPPPECASASLPARPPGHVDTRGCCPSPSLLLLPASAGRPRLPHQPPSRTRSPAPCFGFQQCRTGRTFQNTPLCQSPWHERRRVWDPWHPSVTSLPERSPCTERAQLGARAPPHPPDSPVLPIGQHPCCRDPHEPLGGPASSCISAGHPCLLPSAVCWPRR